MGGGVSKEAVVEHEPGVVAIEAPGTRGVSHEDVVKAQESFLLRDWSKEDVGVAVVQLSSGSLAGWAAGYALRAVGRIAAFAIGTGFIFVQGLAYSGYVHVDWAKVEDDYVKMMDVDHDGQVTGHDIGIMFERASAVLRYNIPSGMGFTLGMLHGMGAASSTLGKAAFVYGVGSRVLIPRVAVAGAAGVGTAGVPAFMAGVQERLGLKIISDEEEFQKSLASADVRGLYSLKSSLQKKIAVSSSTDKAHLIGRLDQVTARMDELGLLEQKPQKRTWWSRK